MSTKRHTIYVIRSADYSSRDPIKAKLLALGEPANMHLLAVALDEAEEPSFRKSVIYYLLVEARSEAAVEPLFNRYVKGKNPGYFDRNDPDGFGLWREVVHDLEPIGMEFR